MIETEISSSDIPIVEEFTPPRFKNWDKQLRFLVQIVSLLAIALFFSNALRTFYEEIYGFISDLLFIGLLLFFLIGLGVSFFQLRYINDKRNKITNLGGIIGLSGLLLTGIPCACEIGLEGLEPSLHDLLSIFLPYILGLGLFLTLIGFFAEATLLDEMLIYTIRTNFITIIRYSLTIIGAFFVNLGALMIFFWPRDLAGGWVTVLGVLIMWGAWFQYIMRLIWNNRISILRMSYLSFSQVLVILMVVIPLLPQRLTPEIFLFVSLPIGIAGITIIYGDYLKFGVPEQIRGFIKKYMLVIQGIVLVCASALIMIGAVYQNFEEPVNPLFVISFRGFYSGVGLLLIYRMWFRIINNIITQSIQFLRTYYKEIVTLGVVIPMIIGVLGFPITEGASLDVYLIPTFTIVAGYLIAVVVWYFPKHSYSRGVNTSFSSVILLWSLLLIIYNVNLGTNISSSPSNLGLLIPGALLVFYLGMDTFLWRKELYYVFQQVWIFIRTYYREFVTIFGLGFMIVGSLYSEFFAFLEVTDPFYPIPVFSFIFGYSLIIIIWRFPKPPIYFRGITTAVSMIVSLWGVISITFSRFFSFDFFGESPLDLWPSIVSTFYLGVGSVISVYLWRAEIKRSVIQVGQVLVNAIKGTIEFFVNVVKTVWNAFKQAFWGVIQFIRGNYRQIVTVFSLITMFLGFVGSNHAFKWESIALFFLGYLVSCSVWRFPTRHEYFRGITTTLSIFTLFWGMVLLLKNGISAPDLLALPFLVIYLLIVVTSVLPIYLWRVELWRVVKQIVQAIKQAFMIAIYSVINFVKAVWTVFKQAFLAILHSAHGLLLYIQRNISRLIQYVKENFWNLVQYLFTIIGVSMINIGLFILIVPPMEQMGILWVFFGVLVICGAWWENTLLVLRAIAHSLMELARSLKNFLLQTSMFLWTKFLTLIEFGREHFKDIAKTVTTLVGVFLVLLGLVRSFGFTIAFLDTTRVQPELFLITGAGILIATWFSQVIKSLKYAVRSIRDALDAFGHNIWDLWVSIKDAVVNFFTYIISLWREIVRATATVVGVLLVIIGISYFPYAPSDEGRLLSIILIIVGVVMIEISWRSQLR